MVTENEMISWEDQNIEEFLEVVINCDEIDKENQQN